MDHEYTCYELQEMKYDLGIYIELYKSDLEFEYYGYKKEGWTKDETGYMFDKDGNFLDTGYLTQAKWPDREWTYDIACETNAIYLAKEEAIDEISKKFGIDIRREKYREHSTNLAYYFQDNA